MMRYELCIVIIIIIIIIIKWSSCNSSHMLYYN